ncbi:LysR family transcriptional regulator [Jannaschia sp. KMU-145]|uniref:LysR family transcriptional regulator n=1 Tax=Jannaschia halovivens TaxID=3388667 RepID=UPI00396B3F5B
MIDASMFVWDNLKVALAIARTGSLSRAALLLDIDQSTASRRLSALEGQLGLPLFVRSRSGLSPTEAGQRALDHAHEIERRVARLGDDVAETASGPRGLLRLLGNPWVLNALTRSLLPDLLGTNPGIDLRLIAHEPRSPMRGEATLAVWFERAPRPGEFAVPLGEVDYAVYAARGSNPDLLPWVSFFDEDSPRRAPLRWHQRIRASDEERIRLTSTDARDVLDAAKAGLGRAILPICLAESCADLESVGPNAVHLRRVMYLHAHPDTVELRRVQTVMAALRESFHTIFARPDGKRPVESAHPKG